MEDACLLSQEPHGALLQILVTTFPQLAQTIMIVLLTLVFVLQATLGVPLKMRALIFHSAALPTTTAEIV